MVLRSIALLLAAQNPATQAPRPRTSTTDRRHRIGLIAVGLLISTGATALDVNVVGLFPNKAVVQIDGGALKTLSVGQKTRDGIILVSVEREGATLDIEGRRVVLALGHARNPTSSIAPDSVMVPEDARGHFVADGHVNDMPIRFAVDTGATFVTLSAREASRLGIEYRNGHKALMEAANGDAFVYRVKLDTVRVGDVAVHNVDAVITEGNSPSVALLGMSFLNRMDMRREGAIMTLTKRH